MSETQTPAKSTQTTEAATVALIREGETGLEVLLLKRNKALRAFGGVWVYPGGRVDDSDSPEAFEQERARMAAIRETREETGLILAPEDLCALSKWIPPASEKIRFATWIFVARAPDMPVSIDHGEIHDFKWRNVRAILERVPDPDTPLMPPTFMTLRTLSRFDTVEAALDKIKATEDEYFETKLNRIEGGFLSYWRGDSAFESETVTPYGAKRRLRATRDHWVVQNDFDPYETG